MSATDTDALELTDPELISRVRDGDVAAYGTLFSRHVDAATRLARVLVGGPDADDLVSEAFVKVLNVLLGGGGPDVAFRAYLLTAVRRLHIDKVRSQQKLTTTDDMTAFDPGVPFTDTAVAGFEGGAAAKAFASLPERWQMVLWHLEVENQKPADIAPLLGMTANSVSALAYRAREGLRQAFLTMHAGDLVSEACRETNDLLGGYVRHALSRRDAAKVEDHLDHCRRCTAAYLELAEVNSSLAGLLGPVLLGGAAAGYLGGGAVLGAGRSGRPGGRGRAATSPCPTSPRRCCHRHRRRGGHHRRGRDQQPRPQRAARLLATAQPGAGALGVTDAVQRDLDRADDAPRPARHRRPRASRSPTAPRSRARQRDRGRHRHPAGDRGNGTGDGTSDGTDGNGGDGSHGGQRQRRAGEQARVNGQGRQRQRTATATGGTGTGGRPAGPDPSPSNPTTPPEAHPDRADADRADRPADPDRGRARRLGELQRLGPLPRERPGNGVPRDIGVTLRATTSAGDLHSHNGSSCRRSGNSFDLSRRPRPATTSGSASATRRGRH